MIKHYNIHSPSIQKVVKNEIIKWLDKGVMYTISDNKWVSPIQFIPKKGGMIVVEIEMN